MRGCRVTYFGSLRYYDDRFQIVSKKTICRNTTASSRIVLQCKLRNKSKVSYMSQRAWKNGGKRSKSQVRFEQADSSSPSPAQNCIFEQFLRFLASGTLAWRAAASRLKFPGCRAAPSSTANQIRLWPKKPVYRLG